MQAGSTRAAGVEVTNTGELSWPALAARNDSGEGLVVVEIAWLGESGESIFSINRRLRHDLRPGKSFQVQFILQAPSEPGLYKLRLRLRQIGANGLELDRIQRQVEVVDAAAPHSPGELPQDGVSQTKTISSLSLPTTNGAVNRSPLQLAKRP